jgi:hypothetical protein
MVVALVGALWLQHSTSLLTQSTPGTKAGLMPEVGSPQGSSRVHDICQLSTVHCDLFPDDWWDPG